MAVSTSANKIQLPQLIHHSIYYYIRDHLDSDKLFTSAVAVSDSYPSGNMTTAPAVIIDEGDFTDVGWEMAGSDLATINFIIDIYGKSKTQRNSLAWIVRTYLNDKRIPVKDYNEGFPPTVTNQTILGYAEIDDIRLLPTTIVVEGEIPEELRLLRQLDIDCLYFFN